MSDSDDGVLSGDWEDIDIDTGDGDNDDDSITSLRHVGDHVDAGHLYQQGYRSIKEIALASPVALAAAADVGERISLEIRNHARELNGYNDGDGEGEDNNGESEDDVSVPDVPDDVSNNVMQIDPDAISDDGDGEGSGLLQDGWEQARELYQEVSNPGWATPKTEPRKKVLQVLRDRYEWMSVRDRSGSTSDDLWVYDESEGYWDADGEEFLKELMTAKLGVHATDGEINHIKRQLARRNRIDEESLDAGAYDELLIPVKNGVICIDDIEYDPETMSIDIDSVELRDNDPDYRFTYCIDACWDPDNADMDATENWLSDMIPRESDRRVLAELGGHALHPDYPIECFGVLLGPGGSGKSMTIKSLKWMLGEDNVANIPLSDLEGDNGRFRRVEVVDAQLNTSTELSGTAIPSIDKLKRYSAGEEDYVEEKSIQGYNVENSATMLFASDNPPALPQSDRALGRRIYPIEYPCRYVDDPDPDSRFELQRRPKPIVEEELQQSERLQALLIKCVEGLTRMMNEGNLTAEEPWEERVRRYESHADPIKQFVREALVDKSAEAVSASDLEMAYDRFAAERDKEGKTIQDISQVLSRMPELSTSKDRTRAWSDGSNKDTIYEGVTFSRKALKRWVPETSVGIYCDPDELYGDDDKDDSDDGDGDGDGEFSSIVEGDSDVKSMKHVVQEIVAENEDDHPKGVPKDLVVSDISDRADVAESRVMKRIDKAKNDGLVYEPKSGHLRST